MDPERNKKGLESLKEIVNFKVKSLENGFKISWEIEYQWTCISIWNVGLLYICNKLWSTYKHKKRGQCIYFVNNKL